MAKKGGTTGTGSLAFETTKGGDLHSPIYSDGKTANDDQAGMNNMNEVAGPTGGITVPNPLDIPGVIKK